MRLLAVNDFDNFLPSRDLEEEELPNYAILSHTWGPDEDEVTFDDLKQGIGKDKPGYRKLKLCADLAKHDGLSHFWVDTCCIDKTNNVELNTAITSMFRWYLKAVKCYVYLSDVPRENDSTETECADDSWLSDFRVSRWMTRGWTLQELLAPQVVEFYNRLGSKVGDKLSLERHICNITGIPARALRDASLSPFTIAERLSWSRTRRTKKPEDLAYSLAGVCGISLIPLYGEGSEKAMARLRREADAMQRGANFEDFAVPFSLTGAPEIPKFIARSTELEEIHTALNGDGGRRTVVLHGLGGIGKTSTAVEYAKRYRDSYSAVFWFNITDETSLRQSYVKAAKRISWCHPSPHGLGGAGADEPQADVVEAVNAWLSTPNNTRWLAIYDNYDNPKINGNTDITAINIREYLPDAAQGSVVITTRSSQVRIGHELPVQKLRNLDDGVEILSSMSRRALSKEDPAVLALVRRLDGFPLALATAGAYLDQVTVSVKEYHDMYETSWLRLHEFHPDLQSYEDRALHTTWRISLDRVQQQNELSAKLMRLWGYFGNHALWLDLLRTGPSEHIPWLNELTASNLVFSNAMRLLCNYGLVELVKTEDSPRQAALGSYSIHSCVHSWTIYVLNREWDIRLADFAAQAVAKSIPPERYPRSSPLLRPPRLLQHVNVCVRYIINGQAFSTRNVESLIALGVLCRERSRHADAEKLLLKALQRSEEVFGQHHRWTLDSKRALGRLYVRQGRLDEAKAMCQQALLGYQNMEEGDQSGLLEVVSILGKIHLQRRELSLAEAMTERALSGYEATLGAQDLSTLIIVQDLGIVLLNQSKLKEALAMFERALSGYQSLPEGNDLTGPMLTLYGIFGEIYAAQGKLSQAMNVQRQALIKKAKAYGLYHATTSDSAGTLGSLVYNIACTRRAEKKRTALKLMYNPANAGLSLQQYFMTIVRICEKFPGSRAQLLLKIGRMLMWDSKDLLASQCLSLTWACLCDVCHRELFADTVRFVCKYCNDTDICETCFRDVDTVDGIHFPSSACSGHEFLTVTADNRATRERAQAANERSLLDELIKYPAFPTPDEGAGSQWAI